MSCGGFFQSGELSLLLMDEKEKAEQGLKHFNLAAIQEAEELQKKKRKRKKLIAKGQKVPEVDNFKVRQSCPCCHWSS